MFGSSYWTIKEPGPDDVERNDEFNRVKLAVQAAHTYDDLVGEVKESFDRAEAVALKKNAEYDAFVAQDGDGYGRFHETWTDPTVPVPVPRPAALLPPTDDEGFPISPDGGSLSVKEDDPPDASQRSS
jgi:hypothetical protein